MKNQETCSTVEEVEEDGCRKITMWDVPVEVDKDTYDQLVKIGRSEIVNDDAACFNYAALKALKEGLKKLETNVDANTEDEVL
tara:strand:- start:449 stop:697 length:249 start_codon:yes stop_codon:yes gene_type:complete